MLFAMFATCVLNDARSGSLSVIDRVSSLWQDEVAGNLAGVHEVFDSSGRADAIAERSTFVQSGAEFQSFGRSHSGHLLHAVALPLEGAPAAALFDMQFRQRSRVDGVDRLLMRQPSELVITLDHNGLTERRVLFADR